MTQNEANLSRFQKKRKIQKTEAKNVFKSGKPKTKILKNGLSTIESVPEFVTFNTRKLWIKRIFRMSKIVKQYYHHQNTLLAQPTKHMKPQWHSCPY